MATPVASNAAFFAGLPFRPQQGGKRKRDGSPTPDSSDSRISPLANNVSIHANLAHRPKPDETPHDAKRRRANDPGDEVEADESQAVVRSDNLNATANPNTDRALTFDNLNLRGTVAQRVARRRRAAADPFIPRKQPVGKKALVRYKPRQAPVFGLASLMSAEEVQLVVDLNKLKAEAPRVKVAENLNGLPKPALDPLQSTEEKQIEVESRVESEHTYCTCGSGAVEVNSKSEVTESDQGCVCGATAANIHVSSDKCCVCGSVAENGALIHCNACHKAYHPVCIGKGLQGYASYQDERREQAMLEDANFYRKDGGFTCNRCSDKALADRETWAQNELKAEVKRRKNLFMVKHHLNQGETMPRECDHCQQQIIGVRYECRCCVNFDLCRECFTEPAVSSLHQHTAEDMKIW